MSRRHLESALVAGAMIESGLTPCFRFSRIRFVRYCFPPGYDSRTNDRYREEEYIDNSSDPAEIAEDTESRGTQQGFTISSTLNMTCTCCGATLPGPTAVVEDRVEQKANENSVTAMLGEGDCEKPVPVGTTPCRLHMQDFHNRHPWRRLQDDYAIHSVQFSGDGKQLLVGSANTSVRVIHTADGSQRQLPRPSKWALGMPITAIRFMPPKLTWAIGCNSHGEVFAFNPNHEGFETLFKEPQQTYALDLSPDGMELATGGVDKRIRIYTLQQSSLIGMPHEVAARAEDEFPEPSYKYEHSALRLEGGPQKHTTGKEGLPKSSRLHFPGGRPNQIVDNTVRRYVLTRCYGVKDLQDSPNAPEPAAYTGHKQPVPPLMEYIPTSPGINVTEGHSMRIMALRYHPQRASILVSAGWDNIVKIWDTRLQSGPVWQIYGPHVASPDGLDIEDNYLLTASWRAYSSIELWDLRRLNSTTGKNSNKPTQNSVPSSHPPEYPGNDERMECNGKMPQTKSCLGTPECICNPMNGPAEVIPISGPNWVQNKAHESGEYPYAARLLPNRAVVAAGSGFQEVRVVGRDTLLPIVRIPMDSVVQSLDTILDGRYIGVGCSSGTAAIIGLA